MKKIALILVLTVALLCLPACKGKKSDETYMGSVSAESYTTAEEAVKGFLEEEVSGRTTEAKFVAYKKDAELTEKEIADLPLGEYTKGLLSAEKGTVEYEETHKDISGTAAAATSKCTVYILTYTGMFRFFVPPTKSGENLTASYYDSTFQADKYINCTMKVTMTTRSDHSVLTSNVLAKVTENALYEYDTEEDKKSFEFYGIEVNGQMAEISNYGDGFEYQGKLSVTVKDFFDSWFQERFGDLDHTYFVKTETGYMLDGEKYLEFLKAQRFSNTYGNASDVEYIINIEDGRMSDVTMKISTEETEDAAASSYEMTIKFSDFGTTQINIPDDVNALIPAK